MGPKDYYLTLGVSRSESPSGIRARYRDLARTLHPDVAGPQSTGTFQEITEAYEALADPEMRRRHNAELARRERRRPVETVEPSVALRRDPVSLFSYPEAVRPSFEALVERLFRNFTGLDVPRAERPEGLTVEVLLTPEEAARGVVVLIGVLSLAKPQPTCSGAPRSFKPSTGPRPRAWFEARATAIFRPSALHGHTGVTMADGERTGWAAALDL